MTDKNKAAFEQMSDRQLDGLVAQHIMQMKMEPVQEGFEPRYLYEVDGEEYPAPVPAYSTRIEDAFAVVEKLMEDYFGVTVTVNHESGWTCIIHGQYGELEDVTADTAPRAISLAALACGKGEKE